jgi:hypothetical protein
MTICMMLLCQGDGEAFCRAAPLLVVAYIYRISCGGSLHTKFISSENQVNCERIPVNILLFTVVIDVSWLKGLASL